MAGIWEFWKPKDGDLAEQYPDGLVTASVLTTEAVGPLAQVHDRMPLVLDPSAWESWLDPDAGFVIAAFAIHEGREAWEGELVEDEDEDEDHDD